MGTLEGTVRIGVGRGLALEVGGSLSGLGSRPGNYNDGLVHWRGSSGDE